MSSQRADDTRIKGEGLHLQLIRERHGRTDLDPRVFTEGDRFKIGLTCAPPGTRRARVIITQAGQRFEPLPETEVECGNTVHLPGAFRIDGDDAARVCVTVSGIGTRCTVISPALPARSDRPD